GVAGSWTGIALALAWKHLGLAALLLLGAFRAVDESHLEAARNFGAGTARLTRDILVRMAGPSLAVSAVLIFSSMLASFSIPLMMGRGGGAQMLMIDVYYRFGQHGDFETAAALGVVGYLMPWARPSSICGGSHPGAAARDMIRLIARAAALAAAAFAILGPLAGLAVWSLAERWTAPSPWPQRFGLKYWNRMLTAALLEPLRLGVLIALIV